MTHPRHSCRQSAVLGAAMAAAVALAPPAPAGAAGDAEAGGRSTEICVINGAEQSYLFAAQGASQRAERRLRVIAPGEILCATARSPAAAGREVRGTVSVFTDAQALEGCSRLVFDGGPETMLRYADFDRCAWSSNLPAARTAGGG